MSNRFVFIKSTAFQIGALVSILILALFISFNVAITRSSESAFVSVVQRIAPEQIRNRMQSDLNREYDVLRFLPDGTPRQQPLQQEFLEVLSGKLFWMLVIAIIFAFIVGIASARLFTRPLRKLRQAMEKMRNNEYDQTLSKTGTPEVDEVIEQFNILAETLSKVENIRKDMIADASHELKTPLTSIRGQIEGVQDGVFTMDTKRATALLADVDRLSGLINQMQEFSKLRGDSTRLKKTKLYTHELVEKVHAQLAEELLEEGITLKNTVPKNHSVLADEILLESVLSNLIHNAIKYSEGKTITVSATKAELVVKDDGKGIAEEHIDYIFERFYRVEKSRNRKYGGLGIGLAIVKEVVEAHGWEVEARNRSEGMEFVITISRFRTRK